MDYQKVEEAYEALIDHMRGEREELMAGTAAMEPREAEAEAISQGLEYYSDQATVLGHALNQGYIKWGERFEWEDIYEMLVEDMNDEICK